MSTFPHTAESIAASICDSYAKVFRKHGLEYTPTNSAGTLAVIIEAFAAARADRFKQSNADLLVALEELRETSWTDTQDGTEDDKVLYCRWVKRAATAAIAKAKKATP